MTAQELSLFDFGVTDTTEAEKKKAEKAKSTSIKAKVGAKATQVPKTKLEDTLLVHGDWQIHIATETFLVSDFVDEIPEEGVLLDVVREGMERAFNQYTKARTKWDADVENKRLFPDAYAGSKGATAINRLAPVCFSSLEEARKSSSIHRYVVNDKNEFFQFNSSVFGEMITKVDKLPSSSSIEEGFKWTLPKIPSSIFGQVLGLFKHFVKLDKPLEVAVRVYWDNVEQSFVLECPKQTVSPVRVDLQYGDEFIGRNSIRYTPVLEMHSHNVMRAFFSETDDLDEQAYRVYGVIGRLDRNNIEMLFRVKCGNVFQIIKVEDIFDLSITPKIDFPKEWLENVSVKEGWLK